MTWISEHWIALALIALYLALVIRHALAGQRETSGLADYYVGGRRMGGFAVGISFFATYASTNSFVGFSGQAYSWGAPWLLLAVGFVVFGIIAWVWIAPRLRVFTRELGSVTIPDFFGFRFASAPARVLAAVIVVFASLLYMTAVFKGIGGMLSAYLDIGYRLAIALVFLIVVAYTAVGGFISVVKTDVVQGLIMIFAAFVLAHGVIGAAGGIGAISKIMEAPESAHLFSWNAAMPLPVLLGIVVAGSMKLMVEPRMLSRFYALKDREAERTGMRVSLAAMVVVFVLLTPLGLYARAIFPAGDMETDAIVPTLIAGGDIFPPAIASFLLVAIIAAAMSSLDSVLLVTASTCERDLVGLWRPPASEGAALLATRVLVVVLALITAGIALDPPGGIVSLTAFSGSLYGACFFPAILFGLYWRKGDGIAAASSMAAGLAVLLAWRTWPPLSDVHALFPALSASILVYVGAVWARRPEPTAAVVRLFDEMEPEPLSAPSAT